MSAVPSELEVVTTYGYTRSVSARVARPRDLEQVRNTLEWARERRLSIATAGGRNSFGDVFLLDDRVVMDLSRLAGISHFDAERGRLTAAAGTRIPDILARIMPAGWFLCGLSGSLWNTVGGNLGSNIHGKDSWRDGNFIENVEAFRLLCADGEERVVDRSSDPELFAAVPGGLGLLGVVTEVTLRLRKIPSIAVECRSTAVPHFEAMFEAFAALDPRTTDFAYAWVDGFASGERTGRGVFETARFARDGAAAPVAELLSGLAPRRRVALLRTESFWSLYRLGWDVLVALRSEKLFHRAMNRLKLASAGSASAGAAIAFPEFQYPVVKRFSHWRDKFRPHGFHEIQSLYPMEAAQPAFRALLAICRRFDVVPEICSLRRHRDDPTLLSFRGDGLSMTVNHPLKHFPVDRLRAFTEQLLDAVADHGGRLYLAKFPYLSPERFRRMFPEHERFRAIKARVDPERIFWSDAAERLLA
ncbi:MAG: FAD-binding oxidoreductase [Myxococcota bacterium]